MILFIVTVSNSLLIVTRLNYGTDYKEMEKASPFCRCELGGEEDENGEEDEKREEGNKDDDGKEGNKGEEEHEKGEVLGLVV